MDALCSLRKHNLVVVPALAADYRGHRIGYGGGFYDRYLRNIACPTVALVYSGNLLEWVPSNRDDVQVSAVITETGVFRADASAT